MSSPLQPDAEPASELVRLRAQVAELQAALAGEQAVATRAREEASTLLDQIVAYTPIGIGFLDRDLRYVRVNPALAAINGQPTAEHIGRSLAEVLPDLAPQVVTLLRQVLATGEAVQGLMFHTAPSPGDGLAHDWQVTYYPVRGLAGAIIGVGVAIADVTQSTRAGEDLRRAYAQLQASEQELAAHAALLDTLIAHAPIGISFIDADLRFRHINAHMAAINGASPAAHLGRPIGAVLPELAGQLEAIYRQVLSTGEPILDREIVGETDASPGALRAWLASYYPVRTADGATVGVGTIVREITDHKRDAAALQAHAESLSRSNADLARALRLKGEFLAMMSHELRTPLNIILGVTDAIDAQLYGPIGAQQRHALESITRSGRHLLNILSDILDLAHIEAGAENLEHFPIDIEFLCQSAVQAARPAAAAKGLHLQLSIEPGLSGFRADSRRLTQILVNLLDNAVKFTPPDGRVGLEVRAEASREAISFVVWDTGIGVAASDLGRLFRPFTQVDGRLSRRYGGIGLGLTLVRHLVKLHGGSVALESAPGQGSRFTVRLPWAGEGDPRAQGARWPAAWQSPPRVVLADDHEPTLSHYASMLGGQGCLVITARSADEALAHVRAARPHILVLDLQMQGVDDLAIFSRIEGEPGAAAVPIIALSALTMPGDRERCLAAGAKAYLAKPVSVSSLTATIAATIGGAG